MGESRGSDLISDVRAGFFFVVLAFASMLVEPEALSDRMSIVLTLILTLVAFKLVIG